MITTSNRRVAATHNSLQQDTATRHMPAEVLRFMFNEPSGTVITDVIRGLAYNDTVQSLGPRFTFMDRALYVGACQNDPTNYGAIGSYANQAQAPTVTTGTVCMYGVATFSGLGAAFSLSDISADTGSSISWGMENSVDGATTQLWVGQSSDGYSIQTTSNAFHNLPLVSYVTWFSLGDTTGSAKCALYTRNGPELVQIYAASSPNVDLNALNAGTGFTNAQATYSWADPVKIGLRRCTGHVLGLMNFTSKIPTDVVFQAMARWNYENFGQGRKVMYPPLWDYS